MFKSGLDYTGWEILDWVVVGVGALVVLILLVLIMRAVLPKKHKKPTVVEEPKPQVKVEPTKEEPKVEPKEEPQVVVKEEKVEPVKEEPKTPTTKKTPVKKISTSTVKKAETEEPKKKTAPARYHISQNKDTDAEHAGEWRVRKEGSEKTIKFFKTQKEAIEYAEKLAENQDSSIVIHKKDGSIRKQDYKKNTKK